jgi:carbamoyl-phosphate synthase small subunit
MTSPSTSDVDLVAQVTCEAPYDWTEPTDSRFRLPDQMQGMIHGQHIVVYDCGVKRNMLRLLVDLGCRVTVVPAHTSAQEVLDYEPDGVLLSNGPGDPKCVPYLVENVRKLFGQVPIFGICLGQQILGLAMGGSTSKLRFGHHGGNQPVRDLETGEVHITSQNHNFVVDVDSLPEDEVEVTHINLNDGTLEGMRHTKWPIFSVQHHPEAAMGPHDAERLFHRFVKTVTMFKSLPREK